MKRLLALVISIFLFLLAPQPLKNQQIMALLLAIPLPRLRQQKPSQCVLTMITGYQPHTNSITKTTKTGTQRTNRT